MDKKYLTVTDEVIWRDQNAFQTLRWKEHVPVAKHFNELRARYKQHCHNTDDSFSWSRLWRQFKISMMDTELGADGTKHFVNTFENIEHSTKQLGAEIQEKDVISWLTAITTKEEQLRNGNVMLSSDSAINSTNVSDKRSDRPSQGTSQSKSERRQSSSDNRGNKNKNANKTTYGVPRDEYLRMTHDEKDMAFTAFAIRTKLDEKLNVTLDLTKGTCRLGERKNGKFVRCMEQHTHTHTSTHTQAHTHKHTHTHSHTHPHTEAHTHSTHTHTTHTAHTPTPRAHMHARACKQQTHARVACKEHAAHKAHAYAAKVDSHPDT